MRGVRGIGDMPASSSICAAGRRLVLVGLVVGVRLFASLVRERLRRLAAVAVERDRLEPEAPALLVDLAHLVDGRLVRQVHRLARWRPDRNGCAAAIMRTCDIGAR